jgi:anaerobic selenocysteine-containing dehydrogenase
MQPNGDLAIANALLHVLVHEEGMDREFVERHCASVRTARRRTAC